MKNTWRWGVVVALAIIVTVVCWPRTAQTFEPVVPVAATLNTGTPLAIRFLDPITVDTKTNDRLHGVTTRPVFVNELMVLPRDTPVSGKVMSIQLNHSTATITAELIAISPNNTTISLQSSPVTGEVTLVSDGQLLGRAAAAVIGGAVGGAVGAAGYQRSDTPMAGIAANAASSPDEKSELHMVFRLASPITVVVGK